MHPNKHQLSDTEVVVVTNGKKRTVNDWFDRIHGKSWKDGNTIAILIYKVRVKRDQLPVDDEVVQCNDGALYHVTELFPVDSPLLIQRLSK
jgi:hypothetical protein